MSLFSRIVFDAQLPRPKELGRERERWATERAALETTRVEHLQQLRVELEQRHSAELAAVKETLQQEWKQTFGCPVALI